MRSAPSLRRNLVLLSALAIIATLTAAGITLAVIFSIHVHRTRVSELNNELNRLTAIVARNAPNLVIARPVGDPEYEVPLGGSYWQVRDLDTGQVIRSPSMREKTFDLRPFNLVSGHATEFRLTDPRGDRAIGLGRLLSPDSRSGRNHTLELAVVESCARADAADAAYRTDLFTALLVLAIIMVIAEWAQFTVALSPFRSLRDGIATIRRGRASELRGRFPIEVQPLVTEFNTLYRSQDLAIEFARSRTEELAHELKGALQVLRIQAVELQQDGKVSAGAIIAEIVEQMTFSVEHQLGLAHLRQRLPRPAESADLGQIVDGVVRTLRAAHRGPRHLEWKVDIAKGTTVALDRADLFELLGALLENATKWATSQVRVSGIVVEGRCRLSIEDDGPGLSEAEIELLDQRGIERKDPKSGSGIGLHVVRAIVTINGGDLTFSRSSLGGLCVAVSIPSHATPIVAAGNKLQ